MRIFPTSQSNAKCKRVFLVDLRFSFIEIYVSKALFLFDKISLDLDCAFGFGFHLRAVAQVALLLVILTEVIFCLKKLELFNSVKAIVRYYQVRRKLLRFTRKVQFFLIMRYDIKHSALKTYKLYAATFYATTGKKTHYH